MDRFHFYSKLVVETVVKMDKAYEERKFKKVEDYFSQVLSLLSKQEYMAKEEERNTIVSPKIIQRKFGIF